MEEQQELIPIGLGELLREAREKSGRALATIAQDLKIRPEVLASIESSETRHIPLVYLKGYIRSYAQYLGIPSASVEQRMPSAQGADPVVQTIFKERPPRHLGDRWIKASSYVLASAVVIALVWQFTNEAVRFSQGDPLLRPAQTGGERSVSPKETAGYSDSELESQTEIPAGKHLRASIASMNMPDEQSSAGRSQVAEGAWAAIGNRDTVPASQEVVQPTRKAIEIISSADSWVEIVDRNGEKIEMDLLRAGNRRSYDGKAPFHLLLGRASSVEVFHNGEKVDLSPYTRGNVARLTLGADENAPDPAGVLDSDSPATELTPPDQG